MKRAACQFALGICMLLCSLSESIAQESPKAANVDQPILPLLKAYDWNGKDLCPFEHFNGLDKSPMPLIAFCRNEPDNYVLITKQAAKKNGWTIDNLREQAQQNIDDYPCRWQRYRGFMLTASGKDFSAEKLLSRAFLLEAQKMLGVKTILVAAPRRTVLYAAKNDLDEKSLELFKEIISQTLADDSFGNPKISPLIFRFKDGKLVGALIVKTVKQE